LKSKATLAVVTARGKSWVPLVLSPVVLEPHAIGTLGNSGGQNSLTPLLQFSSTSTSSLIPPWIDNKSTAALLDTDQLPIHSLSLGSWSTNRSPTVWEWKFLWFPARRKQFPKVVIAPALLFIHVVLPCRLLRSSYSCIVSSGGSQSLHCSRSIAAYILAA
jgi:hypothetical protein